MRVLVLAPQPFYQERGTPIAVRLAVETLAKKLASDDPTSPPVDLVVYNEGSDIEIPGTRIIRVKTPGFLRGIRPGISLKKILCDVFFSVKTLRMLACARHQQYDVIHAVEEAVFIAWLAKKILGIPYIYDMDSSLALQLTEKWWWCKPGLSLLQRLEGLAIRGSISVAPVCDALQALAVHHGSNSIVMLRDISLLPIAEQNLSNRTELFGPEISEEHQVILYVGNLETYQGIDLLLESFVTIHSHEPQARLVIVGGAPETIEKYKAIAITKGCGNKAIFIGPRPVYQLAPLLKAADILVSPRIRGNNTPMKIYSYLHSGTPLVATNLPTHKQVLTESICVLAEPNAKQFGNAIQSLLHDETLRKRLGATAKQTAEKLYTVQSFETQLGLLYDTVSSQLQKISAVKIQRAHNQ